MRRAEFDEIGAVIGVLVSPGFLSTDACCTARNHLRPTGESHSHLQENATERQL